MSQEQQKSVSVVDIARALGVSRQAAEKRVRGLPFERAFGGGRAKLYAIAQLPSDVKTRVAAQLIGANAAAGRLEGAKLQLSESINTAATRNRRVASLKTAVTTAPPAQRRIDGKLQLLGLWEQFNNTAGLAVMASLHKFADLYNAGEIAVDAEVRGLFPVLSAASLHRWRMKVKREGVAPLAGKYGNRKGDSIIDRQPPLAEFAIAMLVSHPHAGSAHLMNALRARFGKDADVKLPSARALQRWMNAWKADNRQVHTALTNPDGFKNKFMAAFGSQSSDVVRLNQRWELDSTPGDVMLTDGRHTVIGVIDIYSRRARLLVSKNSTAEGVATLLRHTLLEWGVPEVAKTDNGADYTSNRIKRVFRDLDVEQELCPPFQPVYKPHIERFFRTFSHGLLELLPGFIGHDVAERKAIEARASFADRLMKRDGVLDVSLSSAEFQKFCDEWCNNVYLHHAHDGLNGKTPFEMLTTARDTVRTIDDPRALDILLAEAATNNGLRTIQKKGIELDQAWFIAPELGARIGDQVHVRFDPIDLGRIYVFDIESGYICTAECPERTGMDRREIAIKSKSMQIAAVQEQRRVLKATARRIKTDDIVREVLTERAEAAGKLTRFPAPTTRHESAGLANAALAAQPRRAPAETVSADAMEELTQEMSAGTKAKVIEMDPMQATHRKWREIGERLAAGRPVTQEEAAWHQSYKGSANCSAMELMWPDIVAFERSVCAQANG